jgi:hypothetical protein
VVRLGGRFGRNGTARPPARRTARLGDP